MDPQTLKQWLEVASGTFALLAGLVAALWAYIKFILERGLLPPVQFDVDCRTVGRQADKTVLEILLHLKNLGNATLVATNLRVDVRYLEATEAVNLFNVPADRKFGRLAFPGSHKRDLISSAGNAGNAVEKAKAQETQAQQPKESEGILLLPHDTFVQPGVNQAYTFVTAVPGAAAFVRVLASFEYELRPSRFQEFILSLGRRLGLLQYSLKHISEPHTAERVFAVG